MNCPNCSKRPVKRFHTFRLNGVKFKNAVKGYIRCRHCGTLLKQATGSGSILESIGRYEKGFWKWYSLSMLIIFGFLMGSFFFLDELVTTFWISFPFYLVILTGFVVVIEEIKARYWILEEIDDVEDDQKKQPRMGALGWSLLLCYVILMLGGGIGVDKYVDTSGMSEWQYIVVMLIYTFAIAGGSLGIFSYFSEKEEQGSSNNEIIEEATN